MKWQTLSVTGSAHKSPCEWNERVFAECENILQHAPLQTLLLINLSALCFESNLVQPPEKHSAVSGAWLCFEGRGLLPSQSTARLRYENTSSQRSTLALDYTPHTLWSTRGPKTNVSTPSQMWPSHKVQLRLTFHQVLCLALSMQTAPLQ